MYSILQSKRVRGAAGEPLPVVWEGLEKRGIRFLRGQLSLIAAGPGTGKSALTLTLALLSGVPCMYFSADSDAFVQLQRAICIVTGCTMADAERMILDDQLSEVASKLSGFPTRFNYRANPTLDDIELSLESYWEVYGEYPHLIVADNLTNVQGDAPVEDGNPFKGLEPLLDYLHGMARETEAHVTVLHHVTAQYNNGDRPIPMNGIKEQPTRVPEMVLTVHRRGDADYGPTTLVVSPVKMRGGQPDQTGESGAELEFDGKRMQIRDFQAPVAERPVEPSRVEAPTVQPLGEGADPFADLGRKE